MKETTYWFPGNMRQPLKKTQLRKRSKKLEAEMRLYRKERQEFLSKNQFCEALIAPCFITSHDIHHMKGRAGKLLRDQHYWMPVCRSCHKWIEDHKIIARKLGLILYK